MSNKVKIKKKKSAKREQAYHDEGVGQLQMALLNLRQMYDQATQEKAVLQSRFQQSQALVAAILTEIDAPRFVVSEKSLDIVADGVVEGLDIQQIEEGISIDMVFAEEAQDDTPV